MDLIHKQQLSILKKGFIFKGFCLNFLRSRKKLFVSLQSFLIRAFQRYLVFVCLQIRITGMMFQQSMFQEVNSKYPDYTFRYLIESDYHNGLFATLGQLTKAPQPSLEDFKAHLAKMENSPQQHVNIVGIQKKTGRVIAFGTLLICQAPYGKVGKIENIVSCKSIRGKGLGKCIIQILKWVGWDRQCPKITLFCQEKNVEFYNKLGFKKEGIIYAWYNS